MSYDRNSMTTTRLALCLLALAGLGSCGDSDSSPEATCPSLDIGTIVGTVDTSEVTEASGMVASRRQQGVLWVHNDSGDTARVFALTIDGTLLGPYVLEARAIDWEDIALGPGPEKGVDYLYIADIGDNFSIRESIAIYRIPEPEVDDDGGGVVDAGDVATMEIRYPDGAHDAETLLSDPLTGDLFIVTKTLFTPGPTQVFRYSTEDQRTGATFLEDLGEIDLGEGAVATAGDISADGRQIVIRAYQSAQLWLRNRGQSVGEALAGEPCDVPVVGPPEEPQGETIAFTPGGRGYYTLSEGVFQPIYEFSP